MNLIHPRGITCVGSSWHITQLGALSDLVSATRQATGAFWHLGGTLLFFWRPLHHYAGMGYRCRVLGWGDFPVSCTYSQRCCSCRPSVFFLSLETRLLAFPSRTWRGSSARRPTSTTRPRSPSGSPICGPSTWSATPRRPARTWRSWTWVRRQGALVDAVSAGEIHRALAAGYQRRQAAAGIVYTADIFDREALGSGASSTASPSTAARPT